MKTNAFLNQQQEQAIRNVREADQARLGLLFKVERESNFEIVCDIYQRPNGAEGTVRSAWQQPVRTRNHSAECRPWIPPLRPHVLTHDLVHLDLECQAHRSGSRKTMCLAPGACKRWNLCDNAGFERTLFSYVANIAQDLIVERFIERDFPMMLPAQILNLHRLAEKRAHVALEHTPWHFAVMIRALHGAFALFTDKISHGTTSHFKPYRGATEGMLAQRLYEQSERTFANLAPGSHYQLVNRFDELLGVPGLHIWDPRPVFEILQEQRKLGRDGNSRLWRPEMHQESGNPKTVPGPLRVDWSGPGGPYFSLTPAT